jgi:hypothetical protein
MAKGIKTGGRQKGKLNKSTIDVKAMIDAVGKKHGGLKVVIGKLYEMAIGIEVQDKTPLGITTVYSEPPNVNAAKILMEYRFGKPQQTVDLKSDGITAILFKPFE